MFSTEIDKKLIKEISQYNRINLISKSVSLLLFPELYPNTIRIENLINLAVKYANGKKEVNRGILNQILNKKLERVLEDPSEELFSGNIVLPNGNFLMLEGIWEGNIFFAQQLLNAICVLKECLDIYNVALDILKISNYILTNAGIKSYIEPSGTDKCEINLPSNDIINKFSNYVMFDDSKLLSLSISIDNLEYFVIENIGAIDINSHSETILHRKPIIKIGDKYIVIPSFLGFAIRKFILEKCEEHIDKIQEVLYVQEGYLAFSKIKEETINIEQKIPDNLKDKINDEVYKIDIDKVAHLIFIKEYSLANLNKKDWTYCMTSIPNGLLDYIKYISDLLSKYYDNGLVILVFGGIAGGIKISFDNSFTKYHFFVSSLYDFSIMTSYSEFSLLKLWKLKQQENKLLNKKSKILNLSGEMNLYAFWVYNNYNLSEKNAFNDFIWISNDYLLKIRKEVRQLQNVHAAKFDESRYFSLERKVNNSPFLELVRKEIYFVPELIKIYNIFRFLVESDNLKIWIQPHRPENLSPYQYSIIVGLTDMILFWLEKGIKLISNILSNEEHIIHIDLKFANFDKIDKSGIVSSTEPPFLVKYSDNNDILVIFDISIFKSMDRIDNYIEKNIIYQILTCICFLFNRENSKNITKNDIDEIFSYDNYNKQMHVKQNPDVYETFPVTDKKMIFVTDEDVSEIDNNILLRSENLIKENIINSINQQVGIIFKEIINTLSEYDKEKLILKVMENYNKVTKEAKLWEKQAYFIINTYASKENAKNFYEEKVELFNKTRSVLRVLVEIAICHCNKNSKEISTTDLELLLAKIWKIIDFGNISDATKFNLIPNDFFKMKNDSISFDSKYFLQSLLVKYSSSVIARKIEYDISVNSYIDEYQKQEIDGLGSNIENPNWKNFKNAFYSEFNSDIEFVADFVESFIYSAHNYCKTHFILSIDEIICYVKNSPVSTTITKNKVEEYLKHFALEPRDNFEIKDGKLKQNNCFWLFRRPLSLMMKPIIKIENDKYIIFPLLLFESFGYILQKLYDGEINQDLFISNEMKSYVGNMKEKFGQNFNDEVKEWFKNNRFDTVLSNLKMTSIGANKKQYGDLGDIDVLAYDEKNNKIFLAECKRLHKALTPRDIGNQINYFLSKKEKWLYRHLTRYEWFKNNIKSVLKFLKLGNSDSKIIPLLLVNDIMPLQFKDNIDLPKQNIITFGELNYEKLHRAKEI